MASPTSSLLFAVAAAAAFLLCCSSSAAFNITTILDQYPEFSSFNSYLTQTGDADEINRRQTITVLAVNNAAMSSVMGQPLDVIKNVLAVHVVLDYYDIQKFRNLGNGTAILVTMFQATGLATGQMGFLNATVFPWGVALGSAVPGAGLNSNLVQSVLAEPYNISVVQVSGLIVPPGIAAAAQPPPPPPPPPPAPVPAAAPPKKIPAAAPSPSMPKPAHSPKKSPAAAPATAATPSAPAPHQKVVPHAAAPAPKSTPSTPSSPPSPSAFPPTAPPSESPVEPPAAGGTPSSGARVVVSERLAIAAAAMGAALLVGF